MTLWFGPFVDMRPDTGYFYLCPSCYRERIKPHLDQVQGRLAELHPLARHLGLHHEPADSQDETEASIVRPTWIRPTTDPVPAGGAESDDPTPGDPPDHLPAQGSHDRVRGRRLA